MNDLIKSFLIPKADKRFIIRLCLVALVSIVLFGVVLRPYIIKGSSMYPTYNDGQFLLGFRFKYSFRDCQRGDVVMVELAGSRVMYLKRIVALPGETVEFRKGVLYINGAELDEPYVNGPCSWNLPERTVKPGFVYVVGDNRAMPIEDHQFGAVIKKRLYGGPLW